MQPGQHTMLPLQDNEQFLDFITTDHSGKRKATIKIEDGCNNFCSYCIIPYAKGRVRSREAGSIINEIQDAVSNGIKEVVITGIHIASYGVGANGIRPGRTPYAPTYRFNRPSRRNK